MKVINNFSQIKPENLKVEEISNDVFLYSATANGIESLSSMHEGLRKQRTVESARKHLMRKAQDEHVSFMLHKQALFMKKFHFCHSVKESPMGPVWIKIESDNILRLLEYLVPHTIKGKPQEVDYMPK